MVKVYEGKEFEAIRWGDNEWKIRIDDYEDVIFVNPERGERITIGGDDDDGIMRFTFENGATVTIVWDENGVVIMKWGDVDLGYLDYLFRKEERL